ncbi:MAG TPA: FAD-dependent oxidoreductase, partial [Albitalea sp.]|nr:FAD-dependent oxidoreductase [Albitalea sp.]
MGQGALMWRRRTLLAAGTSLPLGAWLAGCSRSKAPSHTGSWVGAQHERGHRLRDLTKSGSLPAPSVQRKTGVAIIGAGVAGLACARALLRRGVDDVQLFELEDSAGGNSRGHRIAGIACPLGAHYLPPPGEHADEIAQLLGELGLRRVVNGLPVYDERHLCHSPQERLFIAGHWHEGLLPPVDALPAAERAPTLAHYRRFAERVAELGRGATFTIPTWRSAWGPALDALDQLTFAQWLDRERLTAPALRWYLDYCCRDDYGAGANEVSAWAGLHYFASRHGFRAPGGEHDERDAVLTWPEGNAWLTQRIAEPLREHIHGGRVALRVVPGRDAVTVDLWNASDSSVERWSAAHVVFAVPLFIAMRLLDPPPPALASAAQQLRY